MKKPTPAQQFLGLALYTIFCVSLVLVISGIYKLLEYFAGGLLALLGG